MIAAHLDALFPGMEVLEHYAFRVTRDADFELSDDAEDLLAAMEDVLRQRTKLGVAVRLEVDARMTPEVLQLLCRELELDPGRRLRDRRSARPQRPDGAVRAAPARAQVPGVHAADAVGARRRRRRRRVPRDARRRRAGAPPVRLVLDVGRGVRRQAARDPNVLAIKQTLYRTGGDEAGIVASLAKAAETGKQVVALVELKARFEEQANIERARMLEQAGAHVVYGLVGLKTHAKILLVVRQEHDGIHRYCHVGTGNYNPKTAVLYEDLGVLSDDDELGDDISELFNHLTGYSRQGEYCKLLVAPTHLRDAWVTLIRGQARPGGVITMKMNALVDAEIIDELYAASAAGARRPHRAWHLLPAPRGPRPVGADHRALDRRPLPRALADLPFRRARRRHRVRDRIGRHDAATSIGASRRCCASPTAGLRARLDEILELNFADDVLAWSLEPDGTWVKVPNVHGLDAQVALQELAIARTKARSVDG